MGHVVKGINGIWKTKSISFYENPFQVQTTIFYATIASLFETITESLPQFLLQSWIYWNNRNNGLIPDSTYYISVGFSLLNILKAIIVFIITRKELIFTIVRLANNIYTEDQICEWKDNALKLKLQLTNDDVLIQMVKYFPNIQEIDLSRSKLTDDGVEKAVKHLRQLKSLNLSGSNITDEGLKVIAIKL